MRRNVLEWGVLVTSLVAVGILVGYLAIAAITASSRGVALEVIAGAAVPSGDGSTWLVPVTVVNHGDEAALSVVVEGSTSVGGGTETSELTIDLVPQDGSAVSAVFGFSAAPETPIQTRIVAFARP